MKEKNEKENEKINNRLRAIVKKVNTVVNREYDVDLSLCLKEFITSQKKEVNSNS